MKRLFSLALFALAYVMLSPLASAHVTPTPGEQAVMDQVSAPTTGVTTCDQQSSTVGSLDDTTTYLLVVGAGSNGSATSRVEVGPNPPTTPDFIVHEDGAITTIASGATAHLLFHQNVSVSGVGNAFWAWIEWDPSPGTTSAFLYADSTGGTDSQLLQPYATSGLIGIIGNFTTRPLGCPHPHTLGRAFNATAFSPPSAPLNLQVRGNLTGIRITWNAPADVGQGLTGYKVFRGLTDSSFSLLATIGTNRSYLDVVEAGTRYHYCVKAYNAGGDSPCSNNMSARLNTGFFGPDGLLWGEDGVEGMAVKLNTTPGGVRSTVALPFFAAFLVISLALCALIPRRIALMAGLVPGVLFIAGIGLFPWFGVLFVGLVIGATLALKRPTSGSGDE